MSKREVRTSGRGDRADASPPASGRALWLALALIVLFTAGLAWRIQTERQGLERRNLDAQAAAADVASEQVNTLIVQAWGALAAAADLGATSGAIAADPRLVARAASQARASAGVVILEGGAVAAATQSDAVEPAFAAAAAMGDGQTWAGFVVGPSGRPTPALARRAGARTLISILSPAALLPTTDTSQRLAIVSPDGVLLAAVGADAAAIGQPISQAWGVPAPSDGPFSDRVVGFDPNGSRMAVGVAVSTGGVRTYVSRAMSIGFAELLPLLLSYLVLIAAPAAAAGAVLLLQSRRERLRAEAAEEKLDQVQRHFRLAADGARAGVWTWRRDKDVVELSQRLSRMLGAPAESLTVPGFIALFVDEDRHKVQLAFAQARDRGALDVAVRANVAGKILFVELRGVAIEDPSAPELAAVVGTAIDITPRREAELRSLTQERRLKEAVESFSGPFALFDQRSRLLMWNRSFATLFQVPANLLRPGASYDAVMTAASSAIRRERHDPNDGQSREIELANGAWLQMVERRTAEGGLLAVGVEITPIKRQEEALIQKERNLRKLVSELERSEGRNKELARKYEEEKIKAEDASRAKTSFLANMSHELRTPLNAVIGFSDMMTKEIFGPLGSPRYKEYVRDIQHSGELLLDMINDILDTAKIEAGRMQIFPKPIDPMDPIEQAVRMVRPRADEKKLQLAVDAEDLPEEIVADFRTVKQMVLNLLSNALKFTESGGVMVRARPHRDGVMIQVIDTGPGIPEAFLSRLAQPFEQVDAELSRKHGGTGLGLAITKSFAEMHGGELHIESEVGKGTVVSIWLPNEAKAQAADVADAA